MCIQYYICIYNYIQYIYTLKIYKYTYIYTYINIPIYAIVCDVEGGPGRQEAMSHVYRHRILVSVAHVPD